MSRSRKATTLWDLSLDLVETDLIAQHTKKLGTIQFVEDVQYAMSLSRNTGLDYFFRGLLKSNYPYQLAFLDLNASDEFVVLLKEAIAGFKPQTEDNIEIDAPQSHPINPRVMAIIQDQLEQGEEIRWFGQSNLKRLFSRNEPFNVFFTLFSAGAFSMGAFASFLHTFKPPFDIYSVITLIFSIIFGGFAYLLAIGRFHVKQSVRPRTYYVLTNQKVREFLLNKDGSRIRYQGMKTLKKSLPIAQIDGDYEEGTIRFGDDANAKQDLTRNTGIDDFFKPYSGLYPHCIWFLDVSEPHKIIGLTQSITE